MTGFIIDHSALPIIELVANIRTISKSRHNPQFNGDIFATVLKDVVISYLHIKGFGGLRHAKKDSINLGWQTPRFRGYVDYMQTDEFETNLLRLIETTKQTRTALMCAEAVPWRCHRSLISDAPSVHGIKVNHIMRKTSARDHTITPWAKVKGVTRTYPKQ